MYGYRPSMPCFAEFSYMSGLHTFRIRSGLMAKFYYSNLVKPHGCRTLYFRKELTGRTLQVIYQFRQLLRCSVTDESWHPWVTVSTVPARHPSHLNTPVERSHRPMALSQSGLLGTWKSKCKVRELVLPPLPFGQLKHTQLLGLVTGNKRQSQEVKVESLQHCLSGELGHENLKNDQLYTSPVSRLGAIRSESNVRNVEPRRHLATICRSTEFCNFDPAVGASTTQHTSCCPSSSTHWNAVLVRNPTSQCHVCTNSCDHLVHSAYFHSRVTWHILGKGAKQYPVLRLMSSVLLSCKNIEQLSTQLFTQAREAPAWHFRVCGHAT